MLPYIAYMDPMGMICLICLICYVLIPIGTPRFWVTCETKAIQKWSPADQSGSKNQFYFPWWIHGAGIYANIKGLYWWNPWHTIFLAAPYFGSVIFFLLVEAISIDKRNRLFFLLMNILDHSRQGSKRHGRSAAPIENPLGRIFLSYPLVNKHRPWKSHF